MNEKGGPPHRSVCTLFAQGRARKWPALAGHLRARSVSVYKMAKPPGAGGFFMCGYFAIFCAMISLQVWCVRKALKISCNVFFHGRQCVCIGRSEIFNSSKKLENLSLLFAFFRQSPKSTLKKSEKFQTENSEIGNFTYKFSQKPPGAGAFVLSFPFVFNGVRTHRAWSRIIALPYYL